MEMQNLLGRVKTVKKLEFRMNKLSFLTLLGVAGCLTSCQMLREINQSTLSIQRNRMAIDESSATIERNSMAIDRSTEAIERNVEALEKVTQNIEKVDQS